MQLCLRHKQTKLRSMPIWNPVSEYKLSVTSLCVFISFIFRPKTTICGEKMAPKVKLVYFSVQGKGEIIRLVLHAGKVRKHRLNTELLQISKVYLDSSSLAETPQLPPYPRIWTPIRGCYWSAKKDDISL